MRTQPRTIAALATTIVALTAAAPAAADARSCKALARQLDVAQVRVGKISCSSARRVLRQARRASRGWRPGRVTVRGFRCQVSYRDGEFFPGSDLYVDCQARRAWVELSEAGSGW